MGINYPLFLIGILITALVIFILRSKQSVEGGLVTVPDVSQVELIPNITQRLVAQSKGIYEPEGSAMSYSWGVPN